MALFTVGCEEEAFLPVENSGPSNSELNDSEASIGSNAKHVFVSEVLQLQVLAAVLPKKGDPTVGQKNEDSLQVHLLGILARPALRTTDPTGVETYSYHVPAENPLELINLVVIATGEQLLEGSVFVYEMSAEFGEAFQQFETDFSTFDGGLKVYPLAKLPEVAYAGIQKTEDGVTDCFEYILNRRLAGPSGGGGGYDGEGPGTIVSDGGPIGGGFQGLGAVIGSIPCTCSPSHEVGEHCACGTGNDSNPGHHLPIQTIRFIRCDELGQTLVANGDTENKNLNPEECPSLLNTIGIVPRQLNTLPAGDRLTELIEATIQQTCYNSGAVMHIIDPVAFESCITLDPSGGVACLTDQIEAYMNSLGLGGVPGTPLSVSFNGLPHDQLAAFFHAAVAGEGNEHVYAGINAVRRNLELEEFNQAINTQILGLAQLHVNVISFSDFENALADYIEILRDDETDLYPSEMLWLLSNPDNVTKIAAHNRSVPDFDQDYVINILQPEHESDLVLDDVLDGYINWNSLVDEEYEDEVTEVSPVF
jgi:hypothetical protein